MAAVMRAIEARYPGTRAVVDPYGDPDGDPDIRWWVWVLDVRRKDMGHLERFASELALNLYGPDPKPFFLGSMGKSQSREYLAEKAAKERRGIRRHRARPIHGSPARSPRRTRRARTKTA